MRQVFHCDTNGKNFLQVDEPVKCDVCGKEISLMDVVIVHSSFSKKKTSKHYLCSNQKCLNKSQRDTVDTWLPCFIVENIPYNCTIVPEVNIEIGTGKGTATVFSAAISNEGIQSDVSSCQTKDRTRLAGRQSLEGARIGADVHNLLGAKDAPIQDDNDARAILEALRDAVPEIPHSERKQIENKGDDED